VPGAHAVVIFDWLQTDHCFQIAISVSAEKVTAPIPIPNFGSTLQSVRRGMMCHSLTDLNKKPVRRPRIQNESNLPEMLACFDWSATTRTF
jgi:hypothetical protein